MTIRRIKFLLAPVMASLLLAVLPGELFAQCTLSWSCAGGMGGGTEKFSDRASCESRRSAALSTRHYQPGGGCSLGKCICTGEGAGSAAPSGLKPHEQVMLDSAYLLGYAIGSLLFGGTSQQNAAALEAERQRQLEETLQQMDAAEKERKAKFEALKMELMNELKGRGTSASEFTLRGGETSSGELALKGITDISIDKLALKTALEEFNEYHKRETERREVFERTADAWCKLNPPLYPVRPLMPIPDDQYERMMNYYKVRKAEWDRRCKEMAKEAASRPPHIEKEAREPATKATPLPIACSSCWSNYDRDSGGCAGLKTNIERLMCVNNALDKWIMCIGGCRSGPNEPEVRK